MSGIVGKSMGGNWDDLIGTLSIEIFNVPNEDIEAARAAVEAEAGNTLAEELIRRGCLSDLEYGYLQDVAGRISGPESETCTDAGISDLPRKIGDHARFETGNEFASLEFDARYVRVAEHDRGGMGRILTVWDRRMGREVALKELLPERIVCSEKDSDTSAVQSRVIRRFLQEAQVTGRLQHPSIIPVHEIGQRDDGSFYYTMKFVRGQTLRDAIGGCKTLEERLKLLPHFVDLCQAMAYAHANGIIHRDLKPENVMVGEFGETLVIDWGLSKSVGSASSTPDLPEGVETAFDSADNDGLTAEGTVMGTPYYMAPEQAAGKLDDLDGRTDVYALGAVLYQLLSGERPFSNLSKMDVLRKLNEGPPTSLTELCPELPRALGAICNRAMARDPEDRYQTAREIADELLAYQAGGLVAAHDYGLGEHIRRFVAQHLPAVVTGVVALCVLIGVMGYSFFALQTRADGERVARLRAERINYGMQLNAAHRQTEQLNFRSANILAGSLPASLRGWEWGHVVFMMNVKYQGISQHGSIPGSRPGYSNLDSSADGTMLLTADDSGCVNLWSLKDNRALYTMQTHETQLLDAKMIPGGRLFASSAIDGEVCVWDMVEDRLVASNYVNGEARELAVTPDGSQILIAGPGGVSVWKWKEAQVLEELYGDGEQMNTVDVSASGRWVAAGDELGMIYLWDRRSGESVLRIMGHPRSDGGNYAGVVDVSFRPGHDMLATSGAHGTVRLWDYEGIELDTFRDLQRKVWSINWYPDGQRFATADEGGGVRIHFVDSQVPLLAKVSGMDCQEIEISADGTQLFIASNGRVVLAIRPEDGGGRFLTGHATSVKDLVFSKDSERLYTVAGGLGKPDDRRVLAWDIDSYATVNAWWPGDVLRGRPSLGWADDKFPRVLYEGLARRGNTLALHPEGVLLAVGDGGGYVHLINLEKGALERKITIPEWDDGIASIAFSPAGDKMVVAGQGSDPGYHVKIIDVATGEILAEMGRHQREISYVSYDPRGRYIATTSLDRSIALWGPGDGTLQRRYDELALGYFYPFQLANDGDTLLLARDSFGAKDFDLELGAPTKMKYSGLQSRVNAIGYSPDERLVVAAAEMETALWDASTGVLYFTVPHGATRAVFSPDGTTLATAGVDGRVGVWHSLPWEARKKQY